MKQKRDVRSQGRKRMSGMALSSAVMAAVVPFLAVTSPAVATTAQTVTVSGADVSYFFNGVPDWPGADYVTLSYQGHLYVPARFVAEQMGASATWDAATQTVAIQSGSGVKAASADGAEQPPAKLQVQTQAVHFTFNGTEKKLDSGYTTLNYNGHVYVPVRFVAENLGAVVTWNGDSQDVGISSTATPNDPLLTSFAAQHPDTVIGPVQSVQFGDQSYLALATEPDFSQGQMSNVYFVAADGTVTTSGDAFDEPGSIREVTTGGQQLVLMDGQVGAHGFNENFYTLQNGSPALFKRFQSDWGISTWLQDGMIDVAAADRTYNWDLTAADGSQDDSANVVIDQYNPNTQSFVERDSFTTGIFAPHPNLPNDPRLEAVDTLQEIYSMSADTTAVPNDPDWTSAAVNAYDTLKSSLSFVGAAGDMQFPALTTVTETDTQASYLYEANGHKLQIDLQKTNRWQVIGLELK